MSKAFIDYDGHTHPSGETGTFLGHNFLPYDDGLSLFVSLDDQSEWHLRLQWRANAQGRLIDHLKDYIQPAR